MLSESEEEVTAEVAAQRKRDEDFMDRQQVILATIVRDATEAEMRGRYFRRTSGSEYAPDRTLEDVTDKTKTVAGVWVDEHHYMQNCRCRVINTTIVQFCPAHEEWWQFYDGDEEATREERWAKLPADTRARFERAREESKKRAAQRADYGKAWRGVDTRAVTQLVTDAEAIRLLPQGKRKRTKAEGDPDT